MTQFGLASYVGCRRVDFVDQTATFCVVSRHVSVMSATRLDVVLARVFVYFQNNTTCQLFPTCRL